MRIYLSGPITGQPNYRRVFREAATILEDKGYTDIVNPAELCAVVNVENFGYENIMTLCRDMLSQCDVVVTLPGWKNSHGCGREVGYAEAMDLLVIEFEDFVTKDRG